MRVNECLEQLRNMTDLWLIPLRYPTKADTASDAIRCIDAAVLMIELAQRLDIPVKILLEQNVLKFRGDPTYLKVSGKLLKEAGIDVARHTSCNTPVLAAEEVEQFLIWLNSQREAWEEIRNRLDRAVSADVACKLEKLERLMRSS